MIFDLYGVCDLKKGQYIYFFHHTDIKADIFLHFTQEDFLNIVCFVYFEFRISIILSCAIYIFYRNDSYAFILYESQKIEPIDFFFSKEVFNCYSKYYHYIIKIQYKILNSN